MSHPDHGSSAPVDVPLGVLSSSLCLDALYSSLALTTGEKMSSGFSWRIEIPTGRYGSVGSDRMSISES